MTKYEFVERLNLEIKLTKNTYPKAKKISNLYPKSICDELLSEEEYAHIVAFRRFVERERELCDDQIYSLLLLSKNEFPVIYNLTNMVSNAIDELRSHGAVSVAMMYKQRKLIQQKNEETKHKEQELAL